MTSSLRKSGVSHETIRELFDYDAETGLLSRKASKRPQFLMATKANDGRDGYVRHYALNGYYLAHHIIWFWWYGEHFVNFIDHIDGDRANNRIENLRDVSHRVNCWNTTRARKGAGLIGAALQKNGRYLARIKVVDRQVVIGTFTTEQESHEAYMEVKSLIHNPEDEGITYEEAIGRIQWLLDKHRKYKTKSNTPLC